MRKNGKMDMCDHTRKDGIQNDYRWGDISVTLIEKKMLENQLRWFRHVQRRTMEARWDKDQKDIGGNW